MAKYIDVNLQEEVPEHILRTDDDFSSDSGDNGTESEGSDEEKDMVMDHGEEFETKQNPRWADAMAKVLKTNAPKGKKTIVLAKAKKLTEVKGKKKADLGFEIDGEIQEEKPDPDSIKEEIPKKKKKSTPKITRKDWNLIARIKPSVLDKNREKALAKIATKGVVQLFNTVRENQKRINKQLNEAGSFRKREKVLKSVDKNAFLDMLMGPTASKQRTNESLKPEIKEEEKAPWNALRDDFMMGGNLKDWDKKLEDPNLKVEVKNKEKGDKSDSDGDSAVEYSDKNLDDSDDESGDDG